MTARPQSLAALDVPPQGSRTAPLVAGVGVLMVGNGLLLTLFGVRSTTAGFSAFVVGAVLSAYYVGFLAGSRVAPGLLRRIGSRRSFFLLAAMVSVVAVLPPLRVVPWFWVALRMAQGFCIAGLYVVIESWLNASANNTNRGRVLGKYVAAMMSGFAIGALLYRITGAGGALPWLVAGAVTLLAVAPVWSMRVEPTAAARGVPIRLRELAAMAPLGTAAMFVTALANAALLGVAAVYATRSGFSVPRTAAFVCLGSVGALVLQAPLTRLADRHPRPHVLLGITTAAALIAAAMVLVPVSSPVPLVGMFLLGGLSYSQFSIVLAEVNDHLEHHHMASAGAHLVAINGVGSVTAPLLVAGAFLWIGNDGYFWVIAAAHAAAGLTVLWFIQSTRRAARPVPVPAQAS